MRYESFPLGSIHATGWLHDQLQLSADSFPGHAFDFYRYVAKSTWIGGDTEYSVLRESAPYWFNYIVPLAWTLGDDRLKAQAKAFLEHTLDHQHEDGWLGPETTKATRGLLARSLLCLGLAQYAEADPSQTDRIVTAMHKFVILVNSMLRDNFTGLIPQPGDTFDPQGFGLDRAHELPLSLQWLYEHHSRSNGALIWETMQLMFEGSRKSHGDWTGFFIKGVFPEVGTPHIKTSGFTHGVNLAQGLRFPAILYRMTGEEILLDQTSDAIAWTKLYHGSWAGSIIADEHLGGLSPQRGSETCMAVEMMFSMAYLHRLMGIPSFADDVERVAFNAFPGAISPDGWSHCYVSQTNQPWSRNLDGEPFQNVSSYGNTFGLEPNYPCCTVNYPQAYPKYAANSYVRNGNDGIAHVLLGPTSIETSLGTSKVSVNCETHYPFAGKLQYTIAAQKPFKFSVRIPAWIARNGTGSYVRIGNGSQNPLTPNIDGLQPIAVPEGVTQIEVNLAMAIKVMKRNGTAAIYYGPLLYALDIEHADDTHHQPLNFRDRKPLPADQTTPETQDWVINPSSPWKFAIDISTFSFEHGSTGVKLANPVWTREAPLTAIWVDGYPIEWPEENGTAGLPPVDPIVTGTVTRVKLIPYAAAKLHIAEFPVVNRKAMNA